MAKLDKNKLYKKNKKRTIFKLTTILCVIAIVLSFVLVNIVERENSFVSFSDNMFFAGTILFALSIIINFIKNIFIFKNRKYFAGKNIKIKGLDGETLAAILDDHERNIFLKYELFVAASKAFTIAGLLSIAISITIVLLV